MRNLSNRNKILIIIVVIAVFHLGTNAVLSRIILGPKPPRPAITRGEFDFRLEYEVDGERIVIEDTIVALLMDFLQMQVAWHGIARGVCIWRVTRGHNNYCYMS